MRYKELVYQGKTYTEKYKIDEVLISKKINWLIDAEVENLRLEIHTKEDEYTLIINAGRWYNGIFQYGVIRDIEWLNGTFKNGVWYNGTWKNGIFEHGLIFNGKFYDGKILAGKIYGGDFFDMEVSDKVEKVEQQPVQPQAQMPQTQTQMPQGQAQSGQTQAQIPQGQTQSGQTQTQVPQPEQETQQVQNTIEALNKTDGYYIRESVIFDSKDNLYDVIKENIDPEDYLLMEVEKINKISTFKELFELVSMYRFGYMLPLNPIEPIRSTLRNKILKMSEGETNESNIDYLNTWLDRFFVL